MNAKKEKSIDDTTVQTMGYANGNTLEFCIYDVMLEYCYDCEVTEETKKTLRQELSEKIQHSSQRQIKKGDRAPYDMSFFGRKIEVKSKRIAKNQKLIIDEDNILKVVPGLNKTLEYCKSHKTECDIILGTYSLPVNELYIYSRLQDKERYNFTKLNLVTKDQWEPESYLNLYDFFYVFRINAKGEIKGIDYCSSNEFIAIYPIFYSYSFESIQKKANGLFEKVNSQKKFKIPTEIFQRLHFYRSKLTNFGYFGDGYRQNLGVVSKAIDLVLCHYFDPERVDLTLCKDLLIKTLGSGFRRDFVTHLLEFCCFLDEIDYRGFRCADYLTKWIAQLGKFSLKDHPLINYHPSWSYEDLFKGFESTAYYPIPADVLSNFRKPIKSLSAAEEPVVDEPAVEEPAVENSKLKAIIEEQNSVIEALLERLEGFLNQSKKHSESTANALQTKKAKGEYTGGLTPFGWKLDETGVEVPDEHEQSLILIVRRMKSFDMSYREIGDVLSGSGMTTRTGNQNFAKSTVHRIYNAETTEERRQRIDSKPVEETDSALC